MSTDPIVRMSDVRKSYMLGKTEVPALRGIDLEVARGEFTTIAGPSGSGKTTLLNLIGCVDVASSGVVQVDGRDTGKLSDRALTNLRLHTLGFIFQSFNLIAVLDVFQNVEFPLLLKGGTTKGEREKAVREILERVGLGSHLRHRPGELSGGQRQRVAVARALVTKPRLVLADEPTANLDSDTGNSIIELLRELNEHDETTFVFSTHDPKVIARARRIIHMVDGVLTEPEARTSA